MRLVGAEAPWPWHRDIGPDDPFGFSWPLAVSRPTAPILGVGFPWILSCETILINGLRGKSEQKFFLALLPWRSRRPTGIPWSWHAEAQNYSWGNLTSVSDFMQSIIA